MLKHNHLIAAALAFVLLTAVCVSAGATTLPMFKQQGDITISREEYNRLKQYEKLDMLMQLVDDWTSIQFAWVSRRLLMNLSR